MSLHKGNICTPFAAQQCERHRAAESSCLTPALLGAAGRCLWLTLPGYVWSFLVDAGAEALWSRSSSFLQGSAPDRASESQAIKGSTRGDESSDAQAGSCSKCRCWVCTLRFSHLNPFKHICKNPKHTAITFRSCYHKPVCCELALLGSSFPPPHALQKGS